MTTEPLLLRPGFQAVYFAAKDNGKREFIYGFCSYTRGVFHAEETGRGQITQIGEQMMDLHSAGQLSTTLSVVPPQPGLPRLVQVHRTCFWHAWLELYEFEDGRFRKVWQVSPWTSEKGAFTRRNTFEFKDVNGDGVADIVNLCVTTQAWQPGAPEERVREVYGWNGKRFSLLAKRPAIP
jgi:hypothetical protein